MCWWKFKLSRPKWKGEPTNFRFWIKFRLVWVSIRSYGWIRKGWQCNKVFPWRSSPLAGLVMTMEKTRFKVWWSVSQRPRAPPYKTIPPCPEAHAIANLIITIIGQKLFMLNATTVHCSAHYSLSRTIIVCQIIHDFQSNSAQPAGRCHLQHYLKLTSCPGVSRNDIWEFGNGNG